MDSCVSLTSPNPAAITPENVHFSLVTAARGGDRAAFGKLYEKHVRMVHAILLARVPRNEVDDLTQDVFLRAMRGLKSLRQPDSFGPWIATIARNRAADFNRQIQETVELTQEPASDNSPLPQALSVLRVIRSLPDAYHETLVMRLVEGMTGPEISALTGMTPDSVRVNLCRGMKMLREQLNREVPR